MALRDTLIGIGLETARETGYFGLSGGKRKQRIAALHAALKAKVADAKSGRLSLGEAETKQLLETLEALSR